MQITSGKIPGAVKLCVYGAEGIGKSTLAAQFPNPLFIDTENGTAHMDVRRLPRPQSWAELMGEIDWAIANPGEMKTLVLDTADWAEQLCTRAVCDRAQKSGIEEFAYGKGYVYLMEEFGKLLSKLEELRSKGVHVLILAHAKMRKFEQPDEMGSYDRWEMKLTKQVAPMLKEWVDALLFANYKTYVVVTNDNKRKAQGGKRVLKTSHDPCWDAKNRFGMPDELPLEYGAISTYLFGATATQKAPETAQKAPETAPINTATNSTATDATPVQSTQLGEEVPILANRSNPELWEGIPDELAALMTNDGVMPEEIMYIVSDQKGYYPSGTPIRAYAADFIQGWAIGLWPQVLATVKKNREELPF